MAILAPFRIRRIIEDIRIYNGGGGHKPVYPPGICVEVYENVRQLSASTGEIARDLYTGESRFVYELIQNAEDNSYGRSQNDDPYISFTLMPNEIIVENNEAGFTEKDVRSICKVGDSTKSNRTGYISERGLGFKSVFQVAWKVRIQSRRFDFRFEHLPADTTGLGMVTPFYEMFGPGWPDGTRMTLTLLDPSDFSKRSEDLLGIPDVLILFLSKLRRIEVSVLDSNTGTTSSVVHESHDGGGEQQGSPMWILTRKNDEISRKYFHVERETFEGLPEDPARKKRDRAEVVLAFPTTSDSKPIFEPQLTYSFLPIGNFGFRFIIQSAFITTANGQDVRPCPWNNALLSHVCDVFIDAVKKFCKIPALQYEWLYFLPGSDITHEYWKDLHEMIKGELPGHAVLLSNSGIQNFPNKLRRVPETFRDKNGMPLFEDLQREVYLSVKYHSVHTEYLRDFGVTDLTWSNMIARITPYFEGENPRFLRPDHDEDWHTRVANLLMEGLVSAAPVIRTKIRQLPLIPLRDGPLSNNWTDYIYFPTDTLGHAVPADLGLRVVDNNALRNNTRKSLYEKLGVQYCEPSFVISQIIKRYGSPLDIALSDSVSHLKYLYRTLSDDQALDECIFVMDQNEVPIYRKSVMFVMDKNEIPNHRSSVTTGKSLIADDLYFNTSGNFGTEHLAEELKTNGQPGLHIIHKAYLEAFSLREVINARRWKEWLKKKALIRKVPKLRHSSTSGISPVFNQIIKCRPQLLVGVLKRHWNSYKSQDSTSIKEYFKDATIPCRGAVSIRRRFENTYLPTPQLLTICQQACVENNFDYFLDLSTFPDEPIGNDLAEWEFLEVFGVGTKPDTEFFRIVLSTLTSKINGEDLKRGLFYIYEQISTELPNVDSTQIREILDDLSAVCIPTDTFRTTDLSRCVWNGLPCLQVKNCLSQYLEYTDNTWVRYLFRDNLALEDADWETYLEELIYLQEHISVDQLSFEDLQAIYTELQVVTQDENNWDTILAEFEKYRLIYIPAEQVWVSPSSCVWGEDPGIGRIYGVSAVYPDLADLFMDTLLIKEPTIATYIEELRHLIAKPFPRDIASIKGAIKCISNLDPTIEDLDELLNLSCLPVHVPGSSTIKLMKPSDKFFIADRREYEQVFKEKVPVLDFLLEEIYYLWPFIEALELTDRYMSVAVQEKTGVQQSSEALSKSLSQDFRAKAGALYRCALHYGCIKAGTDGPEIYHKLRHALVYESDGITKTLDLSYGYRTIKSSNERATFHLEDKNGVLRLFVPKDKAQREKCYLTQLPKAILRYLFFDDIPEASCFLLLILHASTDVLDEILEEEGIAKFPDSDMVAFEQAKTSEDFLGEGDCLLIEGADGPSH